MPRSTDLAVVSPPLPLAHLVERAQAYAVDSRAGSTRAKLTSRTSPASKLGACTRRLRARCGGARGGRRSEAKLPPRMWLVGEGDGNPPTTSTQSSCTTGLCDSPERKRTRKRSACPSAATNPPRRTGRDLAQIGTDLPTAPGSPRATGATLPGSPAAPRTGDPDPSRSPGSRAPVTRLRAASAPARSSQSSGS